MGRESGPELTTLRNKAQRTNDCVQYSMFFFI